MSSASSPSSLFDDKSIKTALKNKGLAPSAFPTLKEIGVKLPETIPNDSEGKNALKTKLSNELNTKIKSYQEELDNAKFAFTTNFFNRSLGQNSKEGTIKELQKQILNGTVDPNNTTNSFEKLISKDKFDRTFDSQSKLLTDIFFKTTHQLASLTVGALKVELNDKLGIKPKLNSEQKKLYNQSKEKMLDGIASPKLPSKETANDHVREMAWKSLQAEFKLCTLAASNGLSDMKQKDPEGYKKLQEEAKKGSSPAPEMDVLQASTPMFSPSFERQKTAAKASTNESSAPGPSSEASKPKLK